ncbi:MAG: sigma-70 domain-containing protein, partial [Lachnospiraceae bacterium]|nr:sigma-70 domain-containing protein [Lachnospiraceae bacterium]
EATVEELAERMRMTSEEIKDIMKLAVDALSVTGDYVQTPAESLEQGGAEEI